MISYARKHTEISGMRLKMRADNQAASNNYNDLYKKLCKLNGYTI